MKHWAQFQCEWEIKFNKILKSPHRVHKTILYLFATFFVVFFFYYAFKKSSHFFLIGEQDRCVKSSQLCHGRCSRGGGNASSPSFTSHRSAGDQQPVSDKLTVGRNLQATLFVSTGGIRVGHAEPVAYRQDRARQNYRHDNEVMQLNYDTTACNLQHIVRVILVFCHEIFTGPSGGPPRIFHQLVKQTASIC